MNLPHLQTQNHNLPVPLGDKSLRALSGGAVVRRRGRQTGDDSLMGAGMGLEQVVPRPNPTNSWKTLGIFRKNYLDLPYELLAQIALDLSPQVNKGLYDWLRFSNPGILIREDNARAEASNLEFIRLLNSYYGSFKSHLDSMWAGIFTSGGLFIELVLDEGGRRPIDLAVNNPILAEFRRERHPVRGTIDRLGMQTRFGFRYLDDDPLVKYIGFDKLAGSPYGRPIIGPAVYAGLTLLALLQILQKVLANQGLSRMDYELDAEELLRLIDRNPDIAGDDEATAQFISDQIEKVKNVLQNLEPDSDYVHMSTVKVNYGTSRIQTDTRGLDTIISNLQRDVTNGLKSISSLSNMLDSTTETHIRSQLEYYVSAIQSTQDEVGDVLSQFFNTGNQVQGIRSDTGVHFLKQRTSDKKADAEIEQVRTDTVIKKLDSGIIDEREAREEVDAFRSELEVAV